MATSPLDDVATNSIVVGVDGSAPSLRAVKWAAQEARVRNSELLLFRVTEWMAYDTGWYPTWGGPTPESVSKGEREILDQAEAQAQKYSPSVTVIRSRVEGYASDAIVEHGRRAELVVLGRRGVGGFFNLALGSTTYQVVHQSPRPVVVVPDQTDEGPEETQQLTRPKGVLVGVDGSESSRGALDFAFEEAAIRKSPLTVARAWRHPLNDAPAFHTPFPPSDEDYRVEQEEVLSESLAGWGEKYTDVAVYREVFHGHPAHTLLKAATKADLVVVGSHGHGGFGLPRLGSVSDALVRQAPCPVAVIREM